MEQELFEKEMKKDVEVRRHTRLLKVEFSVKERLDLSEQMGSAYRNKAQAESELKTVKAQYDGKIKQFDTEIANIMEKVNTRWEMRSVECEEVKDFRTGSVFTYRLDTGDRIEERAMTSSERQGALPLKEKEGECGEVVDAEFPAEGIPKGPFEYGPSDGMNFEGPEPDKDEEASVIHLKVESVEPGEPTGTNLPGSPDLLNEEMVSYPNDLEVALATPLRDLSTPEEELPEDDNPFYTKRKKK